MVLVSQPTHPMFHGDDLRQQTCNVCKQPHVTANRLLGRLKEKFYGGGNCVAGRRRLHHRGRRGVLAGVGRTARRHATLLKARVPVTSTGAVQHT